MFVHLTPEVRKVTEDNLLLTARKAFAYQKASEAQDLASKAKETFSTIMVNPKKKGKCRDPGKEHQQIQGIDSGISLMKQSWQPVNHGPLLLIIQLCKQ